MDYFCILGVKCSIKVFGYRGHVVEKKTEGVRDCLHGSFGSHLFKCKKLVGLRKFIECGFKRFAQSVYQIGRKLYDAVFFTVYSKDKAYCYGLSAIMSTFVRLGGGTGRVARVELKMFERLAHNPLQLVETARAALESYLRENVHAVQPKETPDA